MFEVKQSNFNRNLGIVCAVVGLILFGLYLTNHLHIPGLF